MFLNANDIQLGRGEPVKDTARVLGRMITARSSARLRKATSRNLRNFRKIPTINALTDDEHPCQIPRGHFYVQGKARAIVGKS